MNRNSKLELRAARESDIATIRSLIERSMWTLGARDYSQRQIESILKYAMGVDSQLIHDGTYFVVTEGARIVGAGGWSFRSLLHGSDAVKREGDDRRLDPARDAARIRAFFVDPDHARRGIGRMLMSASEAAAAGAGFTRMELVATLTGEKLYRACGFEVLKRIEETFPDGVSAVLVHMSNPIRR